MVSAVPRNSVSPPRLLHPDTASAAARTENRTSRVRRWVAAGMGGVCRTGGAAGRARVYRMARCMTGSTLEINLLIPAEHAGQRLDRALAALLPDYSRSRLKGWI